MPKIISNMIVRNICTRINFTYFVMNYCTGIGASIRQLSSMLKVNKSKLKGLLAKTAIGNY